MDYNIYELIIKPKSSFITNLESDIIWGHIMWMMKYIEGETKFKEILDEFNNGNPPFIVSNGFYTGYLPFYNNSTLNREDTDKLSEYIEGKSKLNTITALKEMKKVKEVSVDIFSQLREGKKSRDIIEECFKGERCPKCFDKQSKLLCEHGKKCKVFNNNKFDDDSSICKYNDKKGINITETKNSINRITDTTIDLDNEKGLFTQTEKYYSDDKTISIYFKVREDYNIDDLKKYIDFISKTGFGKRKSSGKGAFNIISFEKNSDIFIELENSNGYMVLSNYIPKEDDYENVIISNIITKRGKLGGEYSYTEKPFKKPIVMYQPGSVFKLKNNLKNYDYYGKMQDNIHFNSKIVQYGYAFSVGVIVDE